MGVVKRYLSQAQRIAAYERQVADLVEHAADTAVRLAKHGEEIGLHVKALDALGEALRTHTDLLRTLVALHSPRWRDRRAARRNLREQARRQA